jgi:cold shock CspA family protein
LATGTVKFFNEQRGFGFMFDVAPGKKGEEAQNLWVL